MHYTENDQPLKDGDLVLIDAGCEFAMYAGDITRTFPVNGKFTQPQREIYELVLKAQNARSSYWCQVIQLNWRMTEVIRIKTQGLVDLGILKGDVDS